MALNVNALLRDYKSAGVYTIEVDNTVRTIDESQSLRLLVGFNGKGPFNRPVYLESDLDRQRIFGDIDTRLEHKGCFFNRMAQTMLQAGPIFALNLLNVSNELSSKDKVNVAAMSLASSTPNPKIWQSGSDQLYMKQFGQYDYLKVVDEKLYTFEENETAVPYVGAVNFAELYDRSKFWIPSPENLTVASAYLQGNNTSELFSSNFLNFGNIGTEEFSILVFKPENLKGFDITAAEWYGGKDNIPYGFIRPYDYISDYFLQVICVKGNWTNYPDLHTDPIWGTYFDELGIIKNKINAFLAAEGVQLLGSWTGIIIPDFVDKQGVPQNIIDKINKNTETTGLMASFNLDAAISLNYDYNGPDTEEGETGEGCWFLDIDADGEYETSEGETAVVPYMVDMVGHNLQQKLYKGSTEILGMDMITSSLVVGGNVSNVFKYANELNPCFANIKIGDTTYTLQPINEGENIGPADFKWSNNTQSNKGDDIIQFSGTNVFKIYKAINKTIMQTGIANPEILDDSSSNWSARQLASNPMIPLFDYTPGQSLEGTIWAIARHENPETEEAPITWWVFSLAKKNDKIKVTSKWSNMRIDAHGTRVIAGGERPYIVYNKFGSGVPRDYQEYYFDQNSNCIYSFNTTTVYVNSLNNTGLDTVYGIGKMPHIEPGAWIIDPDDFQQYEISELPLTIMERIDRSGLTIDISVYFPANESEEVQSMDITEITVPVQDSWTTGSRYYLYSVVDNNGEKSVDVNSKIEVNATEHSDSSSYFVFKDDNENIIMTLDTGDNSSKELYITDTEIPNTIDNYGLVPKNSILDYNEINDDNHTPQIIEQGDPAYGQTGSFYHFESIVLEDEPEELPGDDPGTPEDPGIHGGSDDPSIDPSDAVRVKTVDYSNLSGGRIIRSSASDYYNCSFLSYNYVCDDLERDGVSVFGDYNTRPVISTVSNVYYFNDPSTVGYLDNGNNGDVYQAPANKTTYSVFICTNEEDANDILVGDYINNLAMGPATTAITNKDDYKIIPGVTKVTSKVFVNVDADNTYTYKGKKYKGYALNTIKTSNGARGEYNRKGFYVYTTTEAIAIDSSSCLVRQLPISDQAISKCLRFIPMKGLKISTRHKPGYDLDGKMNIEGGIEKIYGVLADKGVERGLCNPEMIDYRYIVDSMSHGISSELGGKRYLSELAKKRGKTTAILNLPSKKEFTASVNPYFNDSYTLGINVKPAFDTKYIPQGGNMELYSTSVFTLPDEESGSKFTACFWPNLTYQVNGKTISMPPAADVANTFIRKYNGGNPYVINANLNGLIQNPYVVGLEYDADNTDRDYLEPFGVNTIIRKGGQIMIYGNRTAYQKVKSDLNYLHVREILNTIEINCEKVLYRYNFAYNTAVLRAAVVTALTPILQEVQEAGAIDSYTIICDETNNTPEVIAEAMGIVDINVWFNMGMEKIIQRITINRSFSTNTNE